MKFTCPQCQALVEKTAEEANGCPCCGFHRASIATVQPIIYPTIPWVWPWTIQDHCNTCGLPYFASFIGQLTCQGHTTITYRDSTVSDNVIIKTYDGDCNL